MAAKRTYTEICEGELDIIDKRVKPNRDYHERVYIPLGREVRGIVAYADEHGLDLEIGTLKRALAAVDQAKDLFTKAEVRPRLKDAEE